VSYEEFQQFLDSLFTGRSAQVVEMAFGDD